MNKELFDTFNKLNAAARNQVKHRLKDSPIALKLYDFLERCKNRNFRNSEVVEFIYANEKESTAYNVLENRYFKLRKKFFEEYFAANTDVDDILSDQEKELMRCRQLVQKNEKDNAYFALCDLEKECWNKNIFELLPQIIDNLIFCNQLLNKLDRNIPLYKRMEDALELQADMYKSISYARKVYEINFKKGVSHAKNEFAGMKDLALKHKEYPRFNMCYHHVSLYYKLGSSDYIEDMQVISRHFRQVKELTKKYADLPLVTYRKNYSFHQQMHYKAMTTFYHYNRCEFELAYKAMIEFWDLLEKEPEVYGMYKSESVFFNMFNSQRATFRFADAEKTVEAYVQFLKENKYTSKLPYAHTLRAILYADAWPNTLGLQAEFLKKQMDEYMKMIKDNENVQTSFGEVLVTKAKMHFFEHDFSKALTLINKAAQEKFLKQYDLSEIYQEFFQFYASEQKSAEIKNQLRKKIAKGIALTKKPETLINMRWMQRMLDSKKF